MKLTKAQRDVLTSAAGCLSIYPRFRQRGMFDRLEDRGLLHGRREGGFVQYFITAAGRQALPALTDEGENHE